VTKKIRVSDEYYRWVKSEQTDDETTEEALRRLTLGPHPSEVTGLLTESEAEAAKESVKRL